MAHQWDWKDHRCIRCGISQVEARESPREIPCSRWEVLERMDRVAEIQEVPRGVPLSQTNYFQRMAEESRQALAEAYRERDRLEQIYTYGEDESFATRTFLSDSPHLMLEWALPGFDAKPISVTYRGDGTFEHVIKYTPHSRHRSPEIMYGPPAFLDWLQAEYRRVCPHGFQMNGGTPLEHFASIVGYDGIGLWLYAEKNCPRHYTLNPRLRIGRLSSIRWRWCAFWGSAIGILGAVLMSGLVKL